MTASPMPTAATLRHNKIAGLLSTMLDTREDLLEVVVEAKASDDHLAFGYASWTAYVAGEFAAMLADLNRDDRRLAALALAETGMSSRALAPVLGISDRQVRRDIGEVGHDVPPDHEGQVSHRGRPAVEQVGSHFPPDDDAQVGHDVPPAVTGLDGKRYERPATRTPRRSSLPDAAWKAFYELQKAVDR
ncbi:MAG: helix-turn-helix domain-containing protein, partial [Actinomycetota bacterium]|nr:helix-turn-helix domain-containing protein [Actinomycetota bacterium]